MTLVPFYSLLTVEGPECVKVVMDNIMAGKRENKEDVCIWLITHLLLFSFPSLSLSYHFHTQRTPAGLG